MFGFRHRHGIGRGRGGPSGGGGPFDGKDGRRRFDGDGPCLILLALIAERPRHGYGLIREIETRSGGSCGPRPGVVHPTPTLRAEMDEASEQAERAHDVAAILDDAARRIERL